MVLWGPIGGSPALARRRTCCSIVDGLSQALLFGLFEGDLKGSVQGYIDIDVEVDVDIDRYFGCVQGVSKSVQVLLNGIEAVRVLTLIVRK